MKQKEETEGKERREKEGGGVRECHSVSNLSKHLKE